MRRATVATTLSGAVFGAGLLVFSAVTAAEREPMPNTTYACEVQTRAGLAGLTVIQADDLAEAKASALAGQAVTLSGEKSAVMSVVECIVTPDEEFTDSQMQKFYRGLLR